MYSVIKWSTLRILGLSAPAKVATVVPFLGYFAVYNQYIFNSLGTSGSMQRAITSSHLHCTFLGMLLFGIGSFLFFIFCPIEIREAGSISDFIAAKEKFSTTGAISALYNRACERYKTVKDGFDKIYRDSPPYASVSIDRAVIAKLTHEFRFDLYGIIYDAADNCRRPARYLITGLFASGILVMLVPTWQITAGLLATFK